MILMITNELGTYNVPMFTHNFPIKYELDNLILDNGRQKNLVSWICSNAFNYPPAFTHPVQKGGPNLTISWWCVMTFFIGPFQDTMLCDVSPLDCVDLLLGLPYQHDQKDMYHAKTRQYHLQ